MECRVYQANEDMKNGLFFRLMVSIACMQGPWVAAQAQTEVPPAVPAGNPVTVERIKVHGKALEGNLEGNAADRDVLVFLPSSYANEKSRHYPVLYALHGYSIGGAMEPRDPCAADD